MSQNIYSVTEVNHYIKQMMSQDFFLNRLYVRGEISECKYHSSGHIYFTLKDSQGVLKAVMFAGSARSLKFRMKEGMSVIVFGSVDVYEKGGVYQILAREIRLDGEGELYQRFIMMKKELEEMGMFSADYKKPIPKYIKTLGVVTAETGAAIQDIINISHRRNPYVQLILYPARVQGEGAAESISRGIIEICKYMPDVIIVGRGGGSMEDLWAFNEETVARTIFECPIPIISAVGHETDTTIADFVSDLRAPTPSAAAELAVFDLNQYLADLDSLSISLKEAMRGRVDSLRQRAELLTLKLVAKSPESLLRDRRLAAADYEDRLDRAIKALVDRRRQSLSIYAERLDGLSPLKKLSEGYALVENEEGKAVSSIDCIAAESRITVHLRDGDIKALAEEKHKVNYGN